MDGVGAENPIDEIKRAVRAGRHSRGPEEVAALDKTDSLGSETGPLAGERVVVDPVIAPRRNEGPAAEFDDGTGAFP